MRFRVKFFAVLAAVGLMAALVPSALADPLSLTGEFLVGNPITTLTASCDPSGTSTISYFSTGTATGPYSGTYTESGTVEIGPETLAGVFVNGFQGGPVTRLDATFTIISSDGTVTGSKQLDPASTVVAGFCYDFTDRLVGGSVLSGTFRGVINAADGWGMRYTATVTTPGGVWTDSGISGVSMSEFRSEATSGPNAEQTSVFNEAYRSLSFVPQQDAIAPTAAPSISSGTAGANGWYTSDVTVDWNWTDNAGGSGIDTANCTASSTSTGEGNPITLSATCKDLAGNTGTASYDVKVDKTAPTLNPVVSPNPVLLNGVATVTSSAADALSGLASSSCGAVDTSSVGAKSVTCTATDNAGNSNSATVSYTVIYDWLGFLQPVDNLPTLNLVKAGSAVPVKFSLAGYQGLDIFAAGYPASQQIACSSTATDAIETTATAGSSSLSYDATTDQYNYVWKTDKAWANSCRTLTVKLIDGTIHQANFKFTK